MLSCVKYQKNSAIELLLFWSTSITRTRSFALLYGNLLSCYFALDFSLTWNQFVWCTLVKIKNLSISNNFWLFNHISLPGSLLIIFWCYISPWHAKVQVATRKAKHVFVIEQNNLEMHFCTYFHLSNLSKLRLLILLRILVKFSTQS